MIFTCLKQHDDNIIKCISYECDVCMHEYGGVTEPIAQGLKKFGRIVVLNQNGLQCKFLWVLMIKQKQSKEIALRIKKEKSC